MSDAGAGLEYCIEPNFWRSRKIYGMVARLQSRTTSLNFFPNKPRRQYLCLSRARSFSTLGKLQQWTKWKTRQSGASMYGKIWVKMGSSSARFWVILKATTWQGIVCIHIIFLPLFLLFSSCHAFMSCHMGVVENSFYFLVGWDPLRFALARSCARVFSLPHSIINILQIPCWYGMSCARPCALLRSPAFLMPLYHAMLSKSYLPRRCDWKDGGFHKSPYTYSSVFMAWFATPEKFQVSPPTWLQACHFPRNKQ